METARSRERREPAQRSRFFEGIRCGFGMAMQLKLFISPVKNLAAAEAGMNAFLRSRPVLAGRMDVRAKAPGGPCRRQD